jgi:hypothetical protein
MNAAGLLDQLDAAGTALAPTRCIVKTRSLPPPVFGLRDPSAADPVGHAPAPQNAAVLDTYGELKVGQQAFGRPQN